VCVCVCVCVCLCVCVYRAPYATKLAVSDSSGIILQTFIKYDIKYDNCVKVFSENAAKICMYS
jgi:hypothetical protein